MAAVAAASLHMLVAYIFVGWWTCNWTPTNSLIAFLSLFGESPYMLIDPESGARSPEMHSTVVVLPAPLVR
jgi:hypothetical protein